MYTMIDASILLLIHGFLSSLMMAIHAVLMKLAHLHVGRSVAKLSYWTNAMAAVALIPFIASIARFLCFWIT
jgi:solute carrier family 35 (GDP-fucose transporter), member C1